MLSFLALALLFTWPLQILVATGAVPEAAVLPCMALAGLGPSLAAIVLTRGKLLGELRRAPPAGPALLALLGANLLVLIAALVDAALGGPRLAFALPFWGAVLWPPFGEELGWRVYLYPRAAERRGRVAGALLVGAAWAFWHLPTAIPGSSPSLAALYLLGIVGISLPMAWIFERSGRSAWVAILAHAGVNGVVLAHQDGLRSHLLRFGVFAVAAVLAARALASRGRAA